MSSGREKQAKPKRAMSMECYLRKCTQGALDTHMARVEVKTFDSGATPEERDAMEVAWHEDGEGVFHDICWKALVDSVKNDNPFKLSHLEKEMTKEAKKTAEYFDSFKKVQSEAAKISHMLKSANYAIMFTGAGISTSAGIGDFRGKAGKWTEMDRTKAHGSSKNRRAGGVISELLRPTYTHEAIYKLVELGLIKHIISQNTDGLHRLSGVPREKISELHGNAYHEKCEKCGTRYERPFAARRPIQKDPSVPLRKCEQCRCLHMTGRKCERKGCGGFLMNTIINFGDNLEEEVLSTADQQARRSDLTLCFGSTLRVTPACDLVVKGSRPKPRLAICNRQPTPFDDLCYEVDKSASPVSATGSRVFSDCDALMQEVMKLILLPEDLQEWEEGKESRLERYKKQRQVDA